MVNRVSQSDANLSCLFELYDGAVFGGQLKAQVTCKWSKRLLTTAGITRMKLVGGRPASDASSRYDCPGLYTNPLGFRLNHLGALT